MATRRQRATKPPIPTMVTIVAVLFAVALIGGAYLVGRSIGTPPPPPPSPTPTPPPAMPDQFQGYSLSEESEPTQESGTEKTIVRGNYTDGTNSLILLLTRPEDDLERLLSDGGVTDLQEVPPPEGSEPTPSESPSGTESPEPQQPYMLCGRSVDTGFPACGRIVGEYDTGQMLFPATDMDVENLQNLLDGVPES